MISDTTFTQHFYQLLATVTSFPPLWALFSQVFFFSLHFVCCSQPERLYNRNLVQVHHCHLMFSVSWIMLRAFLDWEVHHTKHRSTRWRWIKCNNFWIIKYKGCSSDLELSLSVVSSSTLGLFSFIIPQEKTCFLQKKLLYARKWGFQLCSQLSSSALFLMTMSSWWPLAWRGAAGLIPVETLSSDGWRSCEKWETRTVHPLENGVIGHCVAEVSQKESVHKNSWKVCVKMQLLKDKSTTTQHAALDFLFLQHLNESVFTTAWIDIEW